MDRIRLVVAFQALSLSIAAWIAVGTFHSGNVGSGGAAAAERGSDRSIAPPPDWSPALPTDLKRERLPVARVPERPSHELMRIPETKTDHAVRKLASLRVSSLTHRAPVPAPIQAAAVTATIDAPSRIAPGAISRTEFGDSARRGRRGRGIDGAGIGSGGFGLGGGECSQGSQRFPGIIERSRRIVPY